MSHALQNKILPSVVNVSPPMLSAHVRSLHTLLAATLGIAYLQFYFLSTSDLLKAKKPEPFSMTSSKSNVNKPAAVLYFITSFVLFVTNATKGQNMH